MLIVTLAGIVDLQDFVPTLEHSRLINLVN